MKVYKKNQHSLFVKPFGVRDRLYLALTVFVYFDLTAPDDPLTEQELWKTIPDQLKPLPLLDAGMPKPRGEVLLSGSCFSPRGTQRNASTISLRVGDLRKELVVFGDRWWRDGRAGVKVITDPLPFSELPLTWQNAFGGKDFAANPDGKGLDPVSGPEEGPRVPLPNIEYRDLMIDAPSQRAKPAGYGVVDMMRPQRQKKTGTYDDKWLKERWPYFPDDMDYEFFNCAPPDQYLDGFFRGGEAIEILNMHPDMQLIRSHLPELRIRCFVTKKEGPKEAAEVFQEVTTHVDTLWLFPTLLRGVVMYRGTTEIWDEEYEDVLRIFLATERRGDPPLSLEYYLEEQKKATNMTVPVDMAPLEGAARKIGAMMKRIKRIPKDFEQSLRAATGQAPVMSRSPFETRAVRRQVFWDSIALLDRLEAQARELQGQYGHLGKIDLTMFERMRGKLLSTSLNIRDGLNDAEAKTAQMRADAAAARKDAAAALRAGADKVRKYVPAEHRAQLDAAIEKMLAPEGKKVSPWHDCGFPLVMQWRRNLEADRDAQDALRALGIEKDTAKRAWLGINPGEIKDPRTGWGLKPSPGADLVLPAGLVLPRFDGAVLNRILILPGSTEKDGGWRRDGNMVRAELVEGSDVMPLLFIAGDGAPVIAVADELQALLMDQEIGDACSVICLARPDEKPSPDGAEQIKKAEAFLIVMPEKATTGAGEAWKHAYPAARTHALPKGDNLFAARRLGVDIRGWIMAVLPPEFQKLHKIAPVLPAPGKHPTAADLTVPIPALDVPALVAKANREIRGYLEGKTGDLAVQKGQLEANFLALAGESLAKAGLNPDQLLQPTAEALPATPAVAGDKMMAQLAQGAAALKKQGTLTTEVEKKLSEAAADIKGITQQAQIRFDAGLAKLAAAKETATAAQAKAAARELPPGVKAAFAKYGLDTDRMVKRTREEVIAMHGRGESLAQARLSGVDLSGVDLSGIDLKGAQCQKTNFAGAILEGANLTEVMAIEADFTGASLRKSKLDKCMLVKAKLPGADLRGAEMKQTAIKDADLTGADLTGATLYLVTIMKTPLGKAKFNDVRANLSIISDGDAAEAEFRGARLERCLLRRLTLDRATFAGASLPSTTFMEVNGAGVVFSGADMHKSRMSNKSRLPGADLRNVTLTLGSLRETELTGSKFTGSCLDGTLIEMCDLQKADLYGVCAQTCRFSKSNLEEADMRYINLFCGSLRKSRLVNADLRGANLYAVDFYKAVFGATQMEQANIKKSLLFTHMEELHREKGII